MATPVFVNSYATSYTTTGTSKNVSISCLAGDTLVLYATTEKSTSLTITQPGSGITFDAQFGLAGDATYGGLYIWGFDKVPNAVTNLTVTLNESTGTKQWGFTCLVYRNTAGIFSSGSYNNTTGAASSTANAGYSHASRITIMVDTAAVDGSSRTWQTVNGYTPTSGNGLELTYQYSSSVYTSYAAYVPDIGDPAFITTGVSAPSGQTYRITSIDLVANDAVIEKGGGLTLYATTTTRSTTTIIPQSPNVLLIGMVYVGVQPANGTDTTVTTSMTHKSIPMTSLVKVHSNNGTQGYIEVFYLKNPPTASGSSVATASTTVDMSTKTFVYSNVDLTNPFTLQTNYGSSTSPSISFTDTLSRRVALIGMVSGTNITAYVPNTAPTTISSNRFFENYNNSSDAGCRGYQSVATPLNSLSLGFTINSGPWAIVGLAINPTTYYPPGSVYWLTG